MNRQLPKASAALAKSVWERQRSPSARTVARALTQSGRPVHYTTVSRWRRRGWRADPAEHPVDQARADLDAVLPLLTGDPQSTTDDLVEGSDQVQGLEQLSDAELLRKAGRQLLIAVCVATHILMRQEPVIVRAPGAVALLFRALAACLKAATAAVGDALRMQAQSSAGRKM